MIRQGRKCWRWGSQWPSQFMQAPQIILWNYCVLCLPFPFLIWNSFSSCGQQLQFLILVLRDLLEILPESGYLMPDKPHDNSLGILFEMLFPNTPPQSLEHTNPEFLFSGLGKAWICFCLFVCFCHASQVTLMCSPFYGTLQLSHSFWMGPMRNLGLCSQDSPFLGMRMMTAFLYYSKELLAIKCFQIHRQRN